MPASDGSKQVAVFGSTGSIGVNALEVIRASGGRLRAAALSAHSRLKELVEQARLCRPDCVVAADAEAAAGFDWSGLPEGCELKVGAQALDEVAASESVDIVLAAIVGSAGLGSTITALEAGKPVAVANKETLVCAGAYVTRLSEQHAAPLLPVDSEHSAIFQAMLAGRPAEVSRLVLTASGGPFRETPLGELSGVTVSDALAHPTWQMGEKITVDSATMMNKALEVIEARWLFGVPAERIEVMVHPQSVVHSMVEFHDGAVVAQLGPPDMRLPIQHALCYPDRVPGVAQKMDWSAAHSWTFEPADRDRFPALDLGFECAEAGGTAGAVLNAANEAAVGLFLRGELEFTQIVPACRGVLRAHDFESDPELPRLVALDRWAREEINRWICA
ncbi:MAG: 1-deoxy-D-xylulose-5-phosphate reductoisomerase [Planctomycetota bacterium]